MQAAQTNTAYTIPRSFVDHYSLDQFVSKFQTTFPEFQITVVEVGPLNDRHYSDLTRLLVAIKGQDGTNALPPQKLKLINSLEKTLIKFEKFLNDSSPTNKSTASNTQKVESPVKDDKVSQQLKGLIDICKQLSDPASGSLQALLDLSWGIGSLPKEKKFSEFWCAFVSERHWMLLEDISRQIACNPKLSNARTAEAQKLVSAFSKSAKILQDIFKTLDASPLPATPKTPFPLADVESLFYPAFDEYILTQVQRTIQTVLAHIGSQEADAWLRQKSIHVKAVFRVVEIIGEASKILSPSARQKLPTLLIGCDSNGEKTHWGKLRNHLHHNKGRCWDIATLAPETWANLITSLLARLQMEISNRKGSTPSTKDRCILETLNSLCEEEQFRDIRKKWQELKADFKSTPMQLKKILLGIDAIKKTTFQTLWETHAKPFLKEEKGADLNRSRVFAMLRLLKRNFVLDTDIDRLTPSSGAFSKNEAVAEMKHLLHSMTANTDAAKKKELNLAFHKLADQFVFLTEPKENLQRDTKKNDALKALMSERVDQISPCQISEDTFKNPDGSPNNFGKLKTFYIKLKCHQLSTLIKKMQDSLATMAAEWEKFDVSAANLESLKTKPKLKPNPKGQLTDCLNALRKEKDFFELAKTLDLIALGDKVKLLSSDLAPPKTKLEKGHKKEDQKTSGTGEDLVAFFQKSKVESLDACKQLTAYLNTIHVVESDIETRINGNIKDHLYKAIDLFLEARTSPSNNTEKMGEVEKKNVEKISQDCAFLDIDKFTRQLVENGLKDLLNLKSGSTSDDPLETKLAKKLDALTHAAEEELSFAFVQKWLHSMCNRVSDSSKTSLSIPRTISLLEAIYNAGLSNKSSLLGTSEAWETITRKMEGKRLPAAQYLEVLTWLRPYDQKNPMLDKQLMSFLDGCLSFEGKPLFDLHHIPRYEHSQRKMDTFKTFLRNVCFREFPDLKDKEDKLVEYFKIAYGINDDAQNKAKSFSDHFKSKLDKLGSIFSEIQALESQDTAGLHREIALLAAEYDMQDIGELAQLITERPSLWKNSRHILSSHHLMWISLMRKMMAHYPLMLAPEIIRWNLEYLAFDTNHIFLSSNAQPVGTQANTVLKRHPLTGPMLRDKMFVIQDHLDRLNLKIDLDVLYPSLQMPFQHLLHPFGELALMVYPTDSLPSKANFIHSVMELELILSDELEAKVSVIGKWQQELVNIPSDKHIPQDYMQKIEKHKQSANRWILCNEAYDLFLTKPWSQVIYRTGKVVTRSEYELHHALVSFFTMLELPPSPDFEWEKCVNSHDLERRIYEILVKEWKKPATRSHYAESPLFKWICCLFERFCPPGTTPQAPICLPKPYGKKRPLMTVLDENGNGLQLLPETLNPNAGDNVRYYYNEDNKQLDIFHGRSLLDPRRPVESSELVDLTKYAIAVLRSHVGYIREHLKPVYGLDRSQFSTIENVIVSDPMLVEEFEQLDRIDPAVATLIEEEAQTLAPKIIELVSTFSQQNGKDCCVQLLELMAIDKEIEQLARPYYGQNRLRLRAPYIQLDPLSKKIFDKRHVLNGSRLKHFPFVNSFRVFIERILEETHMLQLDESSGEIRVSGDLSDHFKVLVRERDIQTALLELLKKRKKTIRNNDRFLRDHYLHWSALFRMVHHPQTFITLKSHVHTRFKSPCTKEIARTLKEDFETQYKIPPAEREISTAKIDEDMMMLLYDSRTYFDFKNYRIQVIQEHQSFTVLLKKLNLETSFKILWEKHFCEPLQRLYYANPIKGARQAINSLLTHSGILPNYNLDDIPTYSDYWSFVLDNIVTMTSTYMNTGLYRSFKSFILEEGSFENITKDPQKKQALRENKALCKLVKDYILFCRLEIIHSDRIQYLKQQTETYNRLQAEKQEALKQTKEDWVVREYDERIKCTLERKNRAQTRLDDVRAQIAQTEFFEMLKLWIRRKCILKNTQDIASEDEQKKQALDLI